MKWTTFFEGDEIRLELETERLKITVKRLFPSREAANDYVRGMIGMAELCALK